MGAQLDAIKLEQLSILLKAVELGNFAAVAQERNISASSISRTIQGLEDHLGFQLFERSTRHLQLTEAGAIYCESIKPGLDSLCQAQVKALDSQNIVQGTLRITLPPGFAEQKVIPLLKKFRKLHPQLKFDILIHNELLDLIRERIDLAIRIGHSPQTGLVVIPLNTIRLKLVATPELLQEHPIADIQDLKKAPAVHFLDFESWHFSLHDTPNIVHDVAIQKNIMANNAYAAREMCLHGLGVSLLPDWMIEDALAQGHLVEVLDTYSAAFDNNIYRINLVYPNTSYLPMKTRVFAEYLEQQLSALQFK
ncbi:LysR family transcriptional regulator [Thiosulfatimonas sediminis]|uniref:LysR family transcriptional regulator n=1 Tax=Thiosulfatimonas sediminis TaxID=2675054 RepID=A0A6F8PY99_9GAMM|nr:LysR family transcriptional regulator [Thiosulfatimonas sediminis]BBP46940.1 LysR family transcriptional regulator [Thiosulfatimonas sediminis]